MADSTRTTTADKTTDLFTQVYESLRDAILTGRFGRGVQLKERALAGELGVSRTPLRQALVRLTADGLLEQVPNVGVFVRRLDFEQTRELLGVRRVLEAGAAACAAEAISDDMACELVALAEEVDAAADVPDLIEVRYLELDFHRRVLELADNSELKRITENTKAIYFTLGEASNDPAVRNRRDAMSMPHADVARAIAGRRPDVAFKAMWDHFNVVSERINERATKRELVTQAERNGLR